MVSVYVDRRSRRSCAKIDLLAVASRHRRAPGRRPELSASARHRIRFGPHIGTFLRTDVCWREFLDAQLLTIITVDWQGVLLGAGTTRRETAWHPEEPVYACCRWMWLLPGGTAPEGKLMIEMTSGPRSQAPTTAETQCLPERARAAVEAAKAVLSGQLELQQASRRYDICPYILGCWIRALPAAGLARSRAA